MLLEAPIWSQRGEREMHSGHAQRQSSLYGCFACKGVALGIVLHGSPAGTHFFPCRAPYSTQGVPWTCQQAAAEVPRQPRLLLAFLSAFTVIAEMRWTLGWWLLPALLCLSPSAGPALPAAAPPPRLPSLPCAVHFSSWAMPGSPAWAPKWPLLGVELSCCLDAPGKLSQGASILSSLLRAWELSQMSAGASVVRVVLICKPPPPRRHQQRRTKGESCFLGGAGCLRRQQGSFKRGLRSPAKRCCWLTLVLLFPSPFSHEVPRPSPSLPTTHPHHRLPCAGGSREGAASQPLHLLFLAAARQSRLVRLPCRFARAPPSTPCVRVPVSKASPPFPRPLHS